MSFMKSLRGIKMDDKQRVVGGDFNIDYLKMDAKATGLNSLLYDLELWSIESGLSQHIKVSTRHRIVNLQNEIRTESACLDHVYGPIDGFNYSTLNIPDSDHVAVCAGWMTLAKPNHKVWFRDWRNYNDWTISELVIKSKLLQPMIDSLEDLNEVNELENAIAKIHSFILEKLCPLRVSKIRGNDFVVDNQIEKLKKRRDRNLKLYWKEGDAYYLSMADSLSKQLKRTIKNVTKRRIQVKARNPDPKTFWKTISDLCGKKKMEQSWSIKTDKGLTSDPLEISEIFADFFVHKARTLSSRTKCHDINSVETYDENVRFLISEKMLSDAVNQMKGKKSFGIDGIPACIVKDLFKYMSRSYLRLMRLATQSIPVQWKTARILPLHKKGCKDSPDNYRPISKLCSMDKLFQRIILTELDRRYQGLEGSHQHGFRGGHGTATAMLEVQESICTELDLGKKCLLYSVDLSAAFIYLRKNVFYKTLKGIIDDDLLKILMDFLSDRMFIVECDSIKSSPRAMELGCVQGSVLGSKLFNLYMKICLTTHLPQRQLTPTTRTS